MESNTGANILCAFLIIVRDKGLLSRYCSSIPLTMTTEPLITTFMFSTRLETETTPTDTLTVQKSSRANTNVKGTEMTTSTENSYLCTNKSRTRYVSTVFI